MSFDSVMFRIRAGRTDRRRDRAIPLPQGVTECRNISYGSHDSWNTLDVTYPNGTAAPLPTIVSIHGGGYVYGSKEIYRRYCMSLARRGFSVVNFNYRLAPKWKFPTPLEDINAVLHWIVQNAPVYHLDPDRILLVGDSAGAQLASQYAAIAANPAYAGHFSFTVPGIRIAALGLNCGMYDPTPLTGFPRKGLARDYLGTQILPEDPRLQVLSAINDRFPPAHVTTACHDFLRDCAAPMAELLTRLGVENRCRCYGSKTDKHIGHVFHVNISLPEATRCNDDQCAFFRKILSQPPCSE